MEQTTAIEILKKAILFEKRGKALYTKVSEQSKNAGVKDLFGTMAAEEDKHITILSDQYRSYSNKKTFTWSKKDEADHSSVDSIIINDSLKKEISSAGYEAAAISAAMSMEKSAVDLYSERSEQAADLQEKSLYAWLAKWEQTHLDFLMALDKELLEKVWNDSQFWPF